MVGLRAQASGPWAAALSILATTGLLGQASRASTESQDKPAVYENRRPDRGDQPRTISLTTGIRGADGRVIALTSDERTSTSPQRPSGGHRFEVRLPLKDVPPGAYALEVTARSSGDERDVVTQRIPIRVR